MAVQAFHSLIWLLCCWLSSTAGLGISRSYSVTTDSVTRTVHQSSRRPLPWMPLPQARFFFEDMTLLGHRIPGLAKNSRCCGVANHENRILNGTATNPNEFPWMAGLRDPSGTFLNGSVFCGGSLINSRYVLTAVHCVVFWPSPQWGQVILGKHETFQNSVNEMSVDIEKIIIHPRYNQGSNLNYDISLIKLKATLDLPIGGNIIAPICLPSRSIFINADVELAGWGYTKFGSNQPDRLHSIKMRTIGNMVCSFLHLEGLQFNFTVQANMVCAMGARGGTGSCNGDSGSPLMVAARYRRSRRALLGITSWNKDGCLPSYPTVFVRVPFFLDWIVANTKDASYC